MGDASVGGVWSTYFKSKKQSEEHTPLSRTEILLAGRTSTIKIDGNHEKSGFMSNVLTSDTKTMILFYGG